MRNELIFEFNRRFKIWRCGGEGQRFLFQDSLSPQTNRIVAAKTISLATLADRRSAFRFFVPFYLSPSPLPVRNHPETILDSHFWQFPAITEKLAAERHVALDKSFDYLQNSTLPTHTYLGLPWASYIDKKKVPLAVRHVFGVRLRGYQTLAESWGLQWGKDIQLHTVCQHICWEKLLMLWQWFGITDLHLSHCASESEKIAKNYSIRARSWPLAAANIVNVDRRGGLSIGKPLSDRTVLASFIGAYMPHYRSSVRIALRDEAKKAARQDVLLELKSNWHLHSIVYREQVLGEKLGSSELMDERVETARYNALLSDSIFSLCPEGAGPNTLRLWESLAVGSIPVVIVDDWVWPTLPEPGVVWEHCVICVGRNELSGIFERLARMRSEQFHCLTLMQAYGMRVYEKFCGICCF